MTMDLQGFINTYNGTYVDYDGAYGAQCADLFNQYTQDVVGGNPHASSYLGAQEIGLNSLTFGGVYEQYPSSILGKAGDVVIWSGSFGAYLGGGYGHVAIMVEDEVEGTGIVRVISQNPGPAHIMNLSTNGCIAYLRPVRANPAPVKTVTGTNQRAVGGAGVKYRKDSNTGADIIQVFGPGDVLDFKGFVHGENVSGNDVWFVGAYTGGFAWSGGFDDSTTNGLSDLTPKAAPAPAPTPTVVANQRAVAASGANQRAEATTSAAITATLDPDFVFTAKGFVHGETVNGNDIWFVGANSGNFVWSGATTNPATSGLPDLTPKAVPAPAPAPVVVPAPPVYQPPVVQAFKGDLKCVTEWIPAGPGNFNNGNFPAKPTSAVIHDFGAHGIDTYESTVNHFKTGPRENPTSAHFVVSRDHITQMVKLKDRAYGAGPKGNDFVQIETDPMQHSAEDGGRTIASVRKLLKELSEFYGYELHLMKHSEIMPTQCGDDVNLSDFANLNETPAPVVVPVPEPTPAPVEVPTTPVVVSEDVRAEIANVLLTLADLIKKL